MRQMQVFVGTCSGFSLLQSVAWKSLLWRPREYVRTYCSPSNKAGNTVDLSGKRLYAEIRVEE